MVRQGLALNVRHSEGQRVDLEKFFRQFGHDVNGMAYLIQRNDVHLSAMLYRGMDYGAAPVHGLSPLNEVTVPSDTTTLKI